MPSPRHPAPAAAASLHCWGLANGLGQTDSSSGWRSRAQPAPARARLQFVTRVRDRPTRRRVACFQAGERAGPARRVGPVQRSGPARAAPHVRCGSRDGAVWHQRNLTTFHIEFRGVQHPHAHQRLGALQPLPLVVRLIGALRQGG